ncbi:rhoptry kinase family protein rop32 [Cystoisospora suis]|uniref:Rhoptry kinase family protein rop32 n=1 Tax=Cystoisospora suis TaxID=483139 RepID=A0A2C6KJB4_9APIC|nr:rhoptry kinase family protein rop32 [Cystoisospora suis]
MAVSRTGASSHGGLPPTGTRMAAAPNNRRRHGSLISIWCAVVACLWLNFMIFSPSESSGHNSFSLALGVRADDEVGSKASESTSADAAEGSSKRRESRKPSRRRSKRQSKGGKDSEDQSVSAEDSSASSSGDDTAKNARKRSVRRSANKPSRRASTRASRDASKSEESTSDKDLEKGEGATGGERKKSKKKSSSGTDEGGSAAATPRGEREAWRKRSSRKASHSGGDAKRRSTSKVGGKNKKDESKESEDGKVKEEGSSKGEDDYKKDEGKESKRRGSTSKGKGDRKKSKSKKDAKKGTSTSRKEGKDESKEGGLGDELSVFSTDGESTTTDADSASTTESEGGKTKRRSSRLSRRNSKRGKSSKKDNKESKKDDDSRRRHSSRTSAEKGEGNATNKALPEASSTEGDFNEESFDLSSILGPKVSTDSVAEGSLTSDKPLSDPSSDSLMKSLDTTEEARGAPLSLAEDFSTSLEATAIDSLLQSNDGVSSRGGPLDKIPSRSSRGGASRKSSYQSSRSKQSSRGGGSSKQHKKSSKKGGSPPSKESTEETTTSLSIVDPLVVDDINKKTVDGDLSQSATPGVGDAAVLVAGEASPQSKDTSDQESFSSLELWKKLARGETVDREGLRRASEKGRLSREMKGDLEKGLSPSDEGDLLPPLKTLGGGEGDFSPVVASSSSSPRRRRRRHERRAEKDAEDTAKLEKRRRREEEEREHRRRMEEEEIYDEFDEEFGYRSGGHNWLLPGPPIVVPPGSWPLRGLLFPDPDMLKQDVSAQRRIASAARELAGGSREQTPVETSELALRRAAGTTAEMFESRFPYGTRFTFQPRHGHSFEPKVLTRGRFIQAGEEALIFEVWEGIRRWALRLRMKHLQDFNVTIVGGGEQQQLSSPSSAGLVNSDDDSPSSSSSSGTPLISLRRRRSPEEDTTAFSSSSLGKTSLSLSSKVSPASRDLEAWERFSEEVCNECEAQEKFAGKILLSATMNEQPRDLFTKERIALPVAVGEIAMLPMLSLLRGDQYITNVAGLYPLAQASVKDLVENYDLPVDVKLELARQMVYVVARLHARGVVHMDLKLGHFLVDRDGYLFLADFSTAEKITEGEQSMENACASSSGGGGASLATLSPEQLSCWLPPAFSSSFKNPKENDEEKDKNKKKTTPPFYPSMSVDSWGLGVSLLQLWCGEIPFRVPSTVEKMSQLAVARYLSELHRRHHGRLDLSTCPEGDISHPDLKQLVEGLLAYEAPKRWLPLDIVFTSPLVADPSFLQGNLLKQHTEPSQASTMGAITSSSSSTSDNANRSPGKRAHQNDLELQQQHNRRPMHDLSLSDEPSSASFSRAPPHKRGRRGGFQRGGARGRRGSDRWRRGSRRDDHGRRGRKKDRLIEHEEERERKEEVIKGRESRQSMKKGRSSEEREKEEKEHE